jgi:PAS domain S-box-containing protein
MRNELSRIVDALQGSVWTALADGKVDFASRQWVEYTGHEETETKGLEWHSAVHPSDLPRLLERWLAIRTSDSAGEMEARLRRFDGVYRWFLFRVCPLRDGPGAAIKWCGIAIDVEERKSEQEARRESELELIELIDRIPGSISVANAQGELVYSSKRGLAYTGKTLDKVQGLGFIQSIHPEEQAKVEQEWLRCVASGQPMELDHRLKGANGVYRWFHVRVQPFIDEQGRVLRWYGLLTDIDDQRTAEEALRQSERRLSIAMQVATVAELSASIAHEINQPLSGIVTNASTCLHMLAGHTPNIDGARETARRTIRDGNRAAEVVTRLRSLFAKKDVEAESVDLNEAAREVIALSSKELQRAEVVLRVELAEGLPRIAGIRLQLQQVVLNLLLNASDAMQAVVGRPRQLILRTELDGDGHVRLSVSDAGVGINPERTDQIFNAFYTTKIDGMGIGLSVSRSIVERHSGRLWATSNSGPGATFSFAIPRHAEGAESTRGHNSIPSHSAPLAERALRGSR